MSTKTVADKQSQALQQKLKTAIASRSALEEDFKAQSSLLIEFINKLSQVSKGINLKLDNRLAQLRSLFKKSAPITDIELKIADISKLLQTHSVTNEQNIAQLHQQFNQAGKNLQKINGLPDNLRRKLRALLADTKSSKESLSQYAPLLSQLLSLYDIALKAKAQSTEQAPLLSTIQSKQSLGATHSTNDKVNSELIKQVSKCLSKIHLSPQHTQAILAINKKLLKDVSNDDVLLHLIEVFDVIVDDLKTERDSAKNFLTKLSETLSTVQIAVKKTISTCEKNQETNAKINIKLQAQMSDMTDTVKKAMSLDMVKIDINSKLSSIAQTLEEKTNFEQQQQQLLASQLNEMASKVAQLEQQSQQFAKELAEQHRKNRFDALTKLHNRAAFDEYFTLSMVHFQNEPFDLAIVVMDIDNFKNINDTYGHTAGDKTLQVIAKTIQKKVSKNGFVARYGGEEFVIIYKHTKKAALVNELNLLNKHIAQLPFKFKNTKVSITLSMGVTHITQDDNIHTAFERADEAMYRAKSQGKNQVIYS